MKHVVYDTGALIAAAKNNQRFLWRHRQVLASGVTVLVPAGVLAQCWDERPSAARLHAALNGCSVLPLTEAAAKASGALCRRNGTTDVIDASVVVTSVTYGGAPIVTDDLKDIRGLVDCANRGRIRVERP
ncbi:hypothetical protein GCM10017771_65930 [Streptomyces capitiformicae]|uniref:PIN domain-containing protein n=1 Tax=Streptomyces capitiformicae TaxID=2014920 RepID=A0A918ZC60_9ACTN|nr:hypothetical protein GCM10017771_65930 [Streptomyces capitiformicae]